MKKRMSADAQTPSSPICPGNHSTDPLQAVWRLEERTGSRWLHLHKASEEAQKKIGGLSEALGREFASGDYSVIVFGSLARREFTPGSDVDWTLLVDGAASEDHWEVACRVREVVRSVVPKEPGREGTFGNLAFSHELLHQIGGSDDTNRNTTRRILLLLESLCCSSPEAYDRVIRGILKRYLTEDEAFFHWRSRHPVPRFLLNDFARFWWTMAVDFAYKRRSRQGEGAVIRNLKLRMSRKLIYASGLLACFRLAMDTEASGKLQESEKQPGNSQAGPRVEFFRGLLSMPPLAIVASHLNQHPHLDRAAQSIFGAYDRFLEALWDGRQRSQLEQMRVSGRHANALYREVREATHKFRDGLIKVFFDESSGLAELTRMYGVF
ncbi:MAG: nucleotidyltransferase domain-containing protein [Bryobacteraceae bacterium]|nr:nucleotidyltransferase domain-containing protein [Bryobacteraceae bacterium]